MKIVEKYDGTKTYMYPNGALATPERVLTDFPAIEHFTHIIETDENHEVIFSMQNLSAMRGVYKIDPSLSEEDAIFAIQEIVNTDPEANDDGESSATERIAAALEYANLINSPIVNFDDPDEE